eukprot:2590255-Karenia_brevis.AAC.2
MEEWDFLMVGPADDDPGQVKGKGRGRPKSAPAGCGWNNNRACASTLFVIAHMRATDYESD